MIPSMLMVYFAVFFQSDCSDKPGHHLTAELNNNSRLKSFICKGRLVVRCQTFIDPLSFINHLVSCFMWKVKIWKCFGLGPKLVCSLHSFKNGNFQAVR